MAESVPITVPGAITRPTISADPASGANTHNPTSPRHAPPRLPTSLSSTAALVDRIFFTVSFAAGRIIPATVPSVWIQIVAAILAANWGGIGFLYPSMTTRIIIEPQKDRHRRTVEQVSAWYFFILHFVTALLNYLYSYNSRGTASKMAPRSSCAATATTKKSRKSDKTKSKQANTSRRGRSHGRVPASRLAELRAARELHKERINRSPRQRLLQDEDIPGPLDPCNKQEVIITRACTAKLKAELERIEDEHKARYPDRDMSRVWPWKTKFMDGTEGPTYHGNGDWRSNRRMLA
ncbi:hypothetical protein BKA64DRAFT_737680 [Cadophora sp. MPI-SDFR-AT-0126]|nr:hypothetical protein BKA64DRAFT_737680 [Leotiomycetes sp. MPI-SDFR-AT-0126]